MKRLTAYVLLGVLLLFPGGAVHAAAAGSASGVVQPLSPPQSALLGGLKPIPLYEHFGIWYLSGNYVFVSGIIGNSSSSAFNFLQVGCQLVDARGYVLAERTGVVSTYCLEPGASKSYGIMVYRPNAALESFSVRVWVTGVPEIEPRPVLLTPVSEDVHVSPFMRTYTVVFRNDTPRSVESPRAGGWELASNGALLSTLFAASNAELPPGGTWAAELKAFREQAPVSSYDYYCEAMVVEGLPGVIAVSGADRYATAVDASRLAFPSGADTVVIATGSNWPDALGGTSLAGVMGGPILLVERDAIPSSVVTEISRLKAKRAIILGGNSAVSAGVESALNSRLGASNVSRIAGANRYQTAERVARRVISELGAAYDGTAFVATGGDFPDALAAAPLASAQSWPLFLADPATGLSAGTKAAMTEVRTSVILGGTAVVSPATESYLRSRSTVRRLAGPDRYGTAVAVATYAVQSKGHSWDRVGITTGSDFPDALAGGVLQGRESSVMLLTTPTTLSARTANTLSANRVRIGTVTFFGGTNAVSGGVRTQVSSLVE